MSTQANARGHGAAEKELELSLRRDAQSRLGSVHRGVQHLSPALQPSSAERMNDCGGFTAR